MRPAPGGQAPVLSDRKIVELRFDLFLEAVLLGPRAIAAKVDAVGPRLCFIAARWARRRSLSKGPLAAIWASMSAINV